MIRITNLALLGILLTCLQVAQAQQSVAVNEHPKSLNKAAAESTAKPQSSATECKICRWFDFQQATISTRYRFVENSAGLTTANQAQHSEAFKGALKLDRKGHYSVNAGVFSGNGFTSSWNNTGAGTGKLFTNLYVKQLYFSAKPVEGVEFQYGGLYVERGESTEATSYDNDAYIMGQRVRVKRPSKLFFDQIVVTYAHLGDVNTPSVFKRFSRLNESNYHQFLVTRSIGKRAVASADYTFHAGVETMREAIRVNTPELKVVDSVKVEMYQRVDVKPDAGYAVSGEKSWFRRKLVAGGGYAQIDAAYGGLNGDRYNKGKRLFVSGSYQLSREFSVNVFWTGAINNPYTVTNKNRLDVIFSYNLLKTLQRTDWF